MSVSYIRELDFQGSEGSRRGQNIIFFLCFFEGFFGTVLNDFWMIFGAKMDQNGALEGPKGTKMEPGGYPSGTFRAQKKELKKEGEVTSGPKLFIDF